MKINQSRRERQNIANKLQYEKNKKERQAYQREYATKKREETKEKLNRLEMLEAYLEQQGILI